MHPALKKGTKISITLAILVEFLVISLFHETKIPMVDMKVQVSSKFRIFFEKKLNLQDSWGMEDFTLPSVASKNGGAEQNSHSSKMLDPSPNNKNLKKIKTKKIGEKEANPQSVKLWATIACRPLCGPSFLCAYLPFFLPPTPFFSTCGQLLLIGSSTCPPYPYFS
jgi:hypothetical protein